MHNRDFIARVVAALREKAKESERYAHLAAHADHLERDAPVNLGRAGRQAMHLNYAWELGVKLKAVQ